MAQAESGGFDWPCLMRAGLCRLRLKPAEFWALTPAELVFLLGPERGAAQMDLAQLEALLRRFPDEE